MSSSEIRLGEIARVTPGHAFKSADFKTRGEYPVIKIKNITEDYRVDITDCSYIDSSIINERHEKFLLKKGDILIAMTGATVGKVGKIREEVTAVLNQRVSKIEPISVSNDYLWSILANDSFSKDVYKTADGAAQANISNTQIENIMVPYFESEDQRNNVAKILGDLDRKIELNRRTNETLEQIGQALFKKFFVDNPESDNWGSKPLDEIAEFKNGLACQKFPIKQGESSLRVIKIKEMSSGFSGNSDFVGSDFPTDYIVENGDLLFAWSGTLMTKIWTEGPGALNQHIFKVTSNEYPKWFYYQWVNEHLKNFVMIAKSKAVTMGHIKRSHLSEVSVKIPPKEYLDKFDELFSSLLDKKISSAVENNILISVRESLLPKLMSGEINI